MGLAVARALALAGREVLVLESEKLIGQHSSSRNSEVIHAGIYYPHGSLKAQLCVEGRERLYRYCEDRGVQHKRLGKLIVATTSAEVETLNTYAQKAAANGVSDLQWLTAEQVAHLEPAVKAVAGLLSPSTGIVDSHGFMVALKSDAEAAGAHVICSSPVLSGHVDSGPITLQIGGAEPTQLRCRLVVNCAGFVAPQLARAIVGFPTQHVPGQHFAKGHYFSLRGASPFRRLVYPVAVPGGLGTHVTLDLGGQARFGPDVCWSDTWDYSFDESRAAAFYPSIRRYYPGLPDGALVPSHVGIRAKLQPQGGGEQDFVIQGPHDHGVAGLIHLFGIESPGLTAALALAARVCDMTRSGL